MVTKLIIALKLLPLTFCLYSIFALLLVITLFFFNRSLIFLIVTPISIYAFFIFILLWFQHCELRALGVAFVSMLVSFGLTVLGVYFNTFKVNEADRILKIFIFLFLLRLFDIILVPLADIICHDANYLGKIPLLILHYLGVSPLRDHDPSHYRNYYTSVMLFAFVFIISIFSLSYSLTPYILSFMTWTKIKLIKTLERVRSFK